METIEYSKARAKKIILVLTALASFLLSLNINAQTKSEAVTKTIQALPHDLEIQLALSALPPHLRDSATVYILNPTKGFELARKGTNGFHAFVARTGEDAMRGSWEFTEYRDDILYPISFDETGSKFQMPVFFDIAAMQAKGMDPKELKKLIKERYKSNYYKAPDKPGVSYMLSPILRTYVSPDENSKVFTGNVPHIMYYAPNVTNKDVGGSGSFSPYPHIILTGAHGYNIQLMGAAEKEAITKGYEEMLKKLCAIKEEWCLPATNTKAPEHQHHH